MSEPITEPTTYHAEHAMAPRGYVMIYLILLVLLGLTVVVAYLHLGVWSVLLAVSIATIKALLVMLYFMHLRHSTRLIWLFAGLGFGWLGIMIVLTMSDYISRSWLQR